MVRKLKKTVWRWCAKYIKLRDTIEDFPVTRDKDIVFCRTCGKPLKRNSKNAQAGHFIGRGLGGSSGVYFDERNIHIQCYQCNAYKQGAPTEYRKYMLEKYGEAVVETLEIKHKINGYDRQDLEGLKLLYKELAGQAERKLNELTIAVGNR